MRICAGNLSHEITEQELREELAASGEIASISTAKDKYSGQPRGFGFGEMPSVSQGQAAITGLNGKMLKDQTLNANAARSPSDNRGGGSYGNRRGGRPSRGWQKG